MDEFNGVINHQQSRGKKGHWKLYSQYIKLQFMKLNHIQCVQKKAKQKLYNPV